MVKVKVVVVVVKLYWFKSLGVLIFLSLSKDGYPVRPKAIHYINVSATFESVFTIFKLFLKEKLKKRVSVYGI